MLYLLPYVAPEQRSYDLNPAYATLLARVSGLNATIAGNIVAVHWQPKTGTFTLDPADISVGDVSAQISGVFVLGLDDLYGPTVAISAAIKDLKVRDLAGGAPTEAFQSISFKGWSAPLYGALGIDQAVLSKPGTRIESKGRIDMLRKGIGFDLSVAGVLGEERYSRYPYMAPDQYALAVSRRTAEFKADYPQRSWREWNLADARAFAELTASERQ